MEKRRYNIIIDILSIIIAYIVVVPCIIIDAINNTWWATIIGFIFGAFIGVVVRIIFEEE